MEQKKIYRINELAKKAKSPQGLTDEELNERQTLRLEYIAGFRQSLKSKLENIDVEYPNGEVVPIRKKKC